MIVSVISITRNNGSRLTRTFDSVYDQSLPEGTSIEHIIVDGGNQPEGNRAIAYAVARGSRHIVAEPLGCYNAINTGIENASGDIIALVHGNDAFADIDIVKKAVDAFSEDPELHFVYGDIEYDSDYPGTSYSNYYSGAGFKPQHLLEGFAPPHPSLFIRKEVMQEIGPYKEDYINAADFDLFIRLFIGRKKYKAKYLPGSAVVMQKGGSSTSLYNRLMVNTAEKRRALHENGFEVRRIALLLRYFKHFDFLKKLQK